MPTLITSFGGGTATNAYADLTCVNSVVTNEVLDDNAWTGASTPNRQKAVLIATKAIDALPWMGKPYYAADYEQGLAFPRTTVAIPLSVKNNLDEDDVLSSQERTLQRACAFQALATLANSGQTIHEDHMRRGIGNYSYSLGKLSESFSYKGAGAQSGTWASLCEDARRELAEYAHARRIVRA